MKTIRRAVSAAIVSAVVAIAHGQTFSLGSSSWGAGGSFQGLSSGGQLYSGMTNTGIYFGTAQPDANTFAFGLASSNAPATAASYDISSAIAANTSLTLTFTGLGSMPKYIAYTGGALTGYSYNAGTLTLTASTVNPVASASDSTGNAIGSAFGLLIITGGSYNFNGTVFRTDMFWEDIDPLASYAGTTYVAGLNASGQNGATASFYAYLPLGFITGSSITQPDDAQARVQKAAGTAIQLSNLTLDFYQNANPAFAGQATTWNYAGASSFNFDGTAGNDDYVLATYTNSSWSDGNIGIALASSVPEPSTCAALFGTLALLTALWRRRALNNAPMR